MATDQYSVLGEAPTAAELKKLASNDIHLTIEGLNAGYGKMEILHDVNLYAVSYTHLTLPTILLV